MRTLIILPLLASIAACSQGEAAPDASSVAVDVNFTEADSATTEMDEANEPGVVNFAKFGSDWDACERAKIFYLRELFYSNKKGDIWCVDGQGNKVVRPENVPLSGML